jgi:glycosyltransferase involved in cell wall biosynthesis
MRSIGINLVGYLNHVLGLGETARQFAGALQAAGIPHAVAALDLPDPARRSPEAHAPWLADAELPYEVTVLWCSPDRYGVDVEPASLPGRRRIARWAWELPALPRRWRHAAESFSEIWTPSTFVHAAVRATSSLPVRLVPPPVAVPPAPALDRSRWGVRDDQQLFLFVFDYHSVARRKNPLGLITAFRDAFAGAGELTLLIKTVNASAHPREATELREAAAQNPGVRIVDAALSSTERYGLIAGCDCYVSLHRSEGFGMTVAEAMAYARPVIATRFGGPVDFLDDRTGYPIPWRKSRVGVRGTAYPRWGKWAEPDLRRATELMRDVVERPADAAVRGTRAAQLMAERYAPAAVGRLVAHELERFGG